MSKVSVVVPIYNAEKTLNKCIKSILNQTFKDFELILVNDGSTDNSLKVCEFYKGQDKRVRLINKENEGSTFTRRRGVEASRSGHVMFVDADDWINKRTIEILYTESLESGVDITVCNTFKVLGSRNIVKKKNDSTYFKNEKIYDKEEIKRKLVVAYFHGHPFPSYLVSKLYKRELLISSGKYLDRIRFLGDDLYYNLEIFLKADSVKVINKSLYYYRLGGYTSKYMPSLFDDMVNGYQIQKEVIDEYYLDTKEKEYRGISIMLLNTLKTCLYNLFNGKLGELKIKELISTYVSNYYVIEALYNNGAIKYFSEEYLNAIRNKDITYLYELGKNMYTKRRPKKAMLNLVSKII
jgi:glycosyltransferase involved in cell wall biosynthesis